MRTQIKIFVIAILTIAFALGAAVMPAMAADSEGTFTLDNTAPEVGTINLCLEGGTDAGSSMTPQLIYNVSMVITDLNRLNDLNNIVVVIQDVAYTYGDPNNVSKKMTYTWTHSGWAETDRPTEGAENTWTTLSTAKCTVPSDLTVTSDMWWLCFTPGKVAKEATWNITVTAEDNASASDVGQQAGLGMQWYGELTANDASFGFGNLALGANNESMTTPAAYIDFTAITNGAYKLQSNTENWENTANAKTITLDTDGGALDPGYFTLKNYGSDAVGSANYVTGSAATITGEDNEVSNYLEAGNGENVHMWLSTAYSGILPYEYAGTYTLALSNEGA